jgi:Protein phosphatase 2C
VGVTEGAGLVNVLAIGTPGRAALELPPGPPPARIGPADVELSTASLPGLVIRAASSRGLQHRADGSVRQDAFALGHRDVAGEDKQAVVVVCDGVGSLYRSDEAALLVSRRLAELAAAGMPWPDAFACANDELRKVAEQAAEPASDGTLAPTMATTAVAVTARREVGVWTGEVAWIGDSTLWHLDDAGQWRLVSGSALDGDDDDYYSGRVRPLPSRDGACDWCGFRIQGGALFVMSDGVGNPLRWSREVAETLAGWWARPPDPFAFAAQVGFARRGHMDDRTVVGIWAGENASREEEPGSACTAS